MGLLMVHANTTISQRAWRAARQQWLHWLQTQGIRPSRFQQQAWRAFMQGHSGLITAPTGSGKTLAALGGPLMQALAASTSNPHSPQSPAWPATAGVQLLWITPLRALAQDTQTNLRSAVAALLPAWRMALRTGDTTAAERSAIRKGQVQLLVTTPESLAIVLSSAAGSATLSQLQAVVVDEWHELLDSKRGVLLQLNLARLRQLAPQHQIWGMSATIGNAQQALDMLVRGPQARHAVMVQDQRRKAFALQTVLPPPTGRLPWSGHLGLSNLGEVLQLVLQHRSCLVFTNTRAQAELWLSALTAVWPLPVDTLAIHHGSLDVQVRQAVEEGLRQQRLRCVVATSSLDLGVDFPAVDLVIQIGGAHSVSRTVQRAGRARHQPGQPVRITAVPTQALELCEFAATRQLAQLQAYEARTPLTAALDVLSQHLMSMACAEGFVPQALLAEVRTTAAFEDLADADWKAVLDFLVHGGAALDAYPQYRRLRATPDGRYVPFDTKVVRRHRLGIGTITDAGRMQVQFLRGARLGSVEESFISKLVPGDTFNFAGRSLVLFSVEGNTAWVRTSKVRGGLTPSWTGGNLPFSQQLGARMQQLMRDAHEHPQALHPPEMRQLQPLLQLQHTRSHVPTTDELLVECVVTTARARPSASKGAASTQAWCIYPFAGRHLHEALALLLAHRLSCSQPNTVAWACNHMGLVLLPERPIDLTQLQTPTLWSTEHLADDLAQALNFTELARRRFRGIAQIAGLVQHRSFGQRPSQRQLQVSAGLLFDVLQRYDPGHVLLQAARQEVLNDALRQPELAQLLQQLAQRTMVVTHPPKHTPWSFGLWAESLRGQWSNESWAERVRRLAQQQEQG